MRETLRRICRACPEKRWFQPPGSCHACEKWNVVRKEIRKEIKARKARAVMSKGEMIRAARIRVCGHLKYYAITDNTDSWIEIEGKWGRHPGTGLTH